MNFYDLFTNEELIKISEWKQDQIEKIPKDEFGLPIMGTIGGCFTYEFTPTTLGVVVKVVNCITKEVLDLTDYGSW